MSVGAPYLSQSSGKVWFEVEIEKAAGCVKVGFAGSNFQGSEIGKDDLSWGLDHNGARWHRRVPLQNLIASDK
jgi:hypothetical protein